MKKREFLQTSAVLGAAAALTGSLGSMNVYAKEQGEGAGPLGCYSTHELPQLPYSYTALDPVIDEKTLLIHYTKHHQGYVNGLINAEKKLAEIRGSGDFAMTDYWTKKLAFHGAGHFLHCLYWDSMTPRSTGKPEGSLAEKIVTGFGSFDVFKKQFEKAAGSVEGSGWGLLAFRPEDKLLFILHVEKHQDLTPWNMIPIMAVDVWEHAYYLKYQNKRGEYLSKWWEIANWKGVNEKLEALMEMYKD